MGAAAAVDSSKHTPDDFSLVIFSCRARCSMFSVVDAASLVVKSAAPSQAPDVHPLLKSLLSDATNSGVPASADSEKRRSRVVDCGEMRKVAFELVEAVVCREIDRGCIFALSRPDLAPECLSPLLGLSASIRYEA